MDFPAPPPLDFPELPDSAARLAALEARIADNLDHLCLPPSNWVPPRRRGGEPVKDVVIVGGGMCGALLWHGLITAGIRNCRIVDRNAPNREGPWMTYARMETLRSPKQLTGPAYGDACLTFRAWFTARFGEATWELLDRIPRPMWNEYLGWYRKVLKIPVENHIEMRSVRPDGDLLRLELTRDGAKEPEVLTRKLVMATGREGTGRPTVPLFVEGIARHYWAHSCEAIDFTALAGRRVVVVGIGASAVDNSAEALEAGAREVRHLIRRREMPRINKMMGIGSFGFTAGYARLPDEWRWRFMHYSFATQTPAPRGSTLRVSRHANAHFHFGESIQRIDEHKGELHLHLASGKRHITDFLILGTGFTIDPLARLEFAGFADAIELWRDAYQPPPAEADVQLGNFPYLNDDFSFRERKPGAAPWLRHIHCFNYAASASLGKVSGDIPGISDGAAWLVRDLAATLYREDVRQHWQSMLDYDKPELLGDEWHASELPVASLPKSGGMDPPVEVTG